MRTNGIPGRSVVGVAALLIAGGALACTSTSTTTVRSPVGLPDNAVMKREVLASLVPCPRGAATDAPPPADLPPPPPALGERPPFEPGLYVELAILDVPARKIDDLAPRDLQALALDPAVRVLSAPQLFVPYGRATTVLFEEHFGPLASLAFRDVTARLGPAGTTGPALELAVGLDLPTPPDATRASPERVEVRATFVPHDRGLSSFVKPVPSRPGRALEVVLTPYSVQGEADFRAIFACKMARRRSSTASPSDDE